MGDMIITDMLVKELNSTGDEFSVSYKVNASELNAAYDKNDATLSGLETFINGIKSDPLKKILRYKVTGYASPDGSMSINERLAMERATDFREYLDKQYDMNTYPGLVDAVAEPWYAAIPLVSNMAVPNKMRVLSILDSDKSANSIESELKGIPSSWSYLESKVLPALRTVELEVVYNSWKEIEVHTQNYERVRERQAREAAQYAYIDDGATGIIFIMEDENPLDYKETFRMKCRKDGFAKLDEKFKFE